MQEIEKNPLSSKINKILATDLEGDEELLDGLKSISEILPSNSVQYRRSMRCELEKRQLSIYEAVLGEYTVVKDHINNLGDHISDMINTCHGLDTQLMDIKCKTNDLISETSSLMEEKTKYDVKVQVLESLSDSFQVASQVEDILSSEQHLINSTFFDAIRQAREVESNCTSLVQAGGENFGLSLLDSVHGVLDKAYQRLFQYIQTECRNLTQESPNIPGQLRRAFCVIQDRPGLLKYSLDEYASVRRSVTLKSFINALTLGYDLHLSSDTYTSGHSKPIELHSHDPLRYTSDMLAWMHQLAASEKDYLTVLTQEFTKSITSDLFNPCLDRITEGLCSPFKMRVEQLMVSVQEAVLLYRLNNIFCFYQHTFKSILGSNCQLMSTLNEVQELSWRLLFHSLNQYIKQAFEQSDYPAPDLVPNNTVRDTLQLLFDILVTRDISMLPTDVRKTSVCQILDLMINPLLKYCQGTADRLLQTILPDSLSDQPNEVYTSIQRAQSATFMANCLYLIETTLARVEFANEQIEKLTELLNSTVDILITAQVTRVLRDTHLIGLLQVLEQGHNPENDGPLVNRLEAGLNEAEIRNALAHFDVYLSNPDRFSLPELNYLTVQRLRKVVRRRSSDDIHSRYQLIYKALSDPENGYTFSSPNDDHSTKSGLRLRTPKQVADLILNF